MNQPERALPVLAQSFLPAIPRVIDNTALSAYMACPREFFYAMLMHYRHKGRKAALTFGAAWHKALEVHYKSGGDRDLVRAAAQIAWEGAEFGPDEYRTLPRLLLDYDKYLKEYGTPDEEERRGMGRTLNRKLVEISVHAAGAGLLHPWAGKLDRPFEQSGLVYIEDHKSTSRLDSNYFKSYDLSNQMLGYTYLGQQILPEFTVVGVRINLIHILKTKTEFHRRLFTFTKDQVKEWVRNTNSWMIRLQRDIKWWEQLNLDKDLALSDLAFIDDMEDSELPFPGHFGQDGCKRMYGLCQFFDVCSVSAKHRPRLLEEQFEKREWNPLEINDTDD